MNINESLALCPATQIQWVWYAASVIVAFVVGSLWYGLIFRNAWIKAVQYKCLCGNDLSKDQKCTCKSHSAAPMIMQFAATCFIGFMYFLLAEVSIMYSLTVLVAMSVWMKAALKFKIAEWNRFVILAGIEVGYFFVASIIFICFAMI